MPPSRGQIVGGRWQIEATLVKGPVCTVYRAVDTRERKPAALKLLHPPLAQEYLAKTRFERDATVTRRLSHPGLIRIFELAATESGVPFVAMELLSGTTMAELIAARGPLPVSQALSVAEAVSGILVETHRHGIVHRSISAEQVFITQEREIKLLGFRGGRDHSTETADPQADLRGLGGLIRELLTGRRSAPGESSGAPTTPGAPVPAALADLLDRLQAGRFSDAAACRQALRRTRASMTAKSSAPAPVPAEPTPPVLAVAETSPPSLAIDDDRARAFRAGTRGLIAIENRLRALRSTPTGGSATVQSQFIVASLTEPFLFALAGEAGDWGVDTTRLVTRLESLLRLVQPEHLPGLLSQAGDIPESAVRRAMIATLEARADVIGPSLAPRITSIAPSLAIAALRILVEHSAASARDVALAAVHHPNTAVRIVALSTQESSSGPRIAAELQKLFANPSSEARIGALELLGDHEVVAATGFLAGRILGSDFHTLPQDERNATLQTLGRLAPSRAEQIAVRLLTSRGIVAKPGEDETRAIAAEVLGHIGTTKEGHEALSRVAHARWAPQQLRQDRGRQRPTRLVSQERDQLIPRPAATRRRASTARAARGSVSAVARCFAAESTRCPDVPRRPG